MTLGKIDEFVSLLRNAFVLFTYSESWFLCHQYTLYFSYLTYLTVSMNVRVLGSNRFCLVYYFLLVKHGRSCIIYGFWEGKTESSTKSKYH